MNKYFESRGIDNKAIAIAVLFCIRTYHRNPNMNPPIRQKLKHNRPLRRKHIRVLFLRLSLALRSRQSRTIVNRLPRRRGTRRIHESSWVRWRTELVRLAQGAVLVIAGFAGLAF